MYEVCCVECCNKLKTFPPPPGRPVPSLPDIRPGRGGGTGLLNINEVFKFNSSLFLGDFLSIFYRMAKKSIYGHISMEEGGQLSLELEHE